MRRARAIHRAPALLLALLVGALATLSAPAQDDGDRQTDEWRERDRRYMERQAAAHRDGDDAGDGDARRAAFLAQAESLVRDRNYDAADSEHVRVQTDDPRLSPTAAAELLERFVPFFESVWRGKIELAPFGDRSRVFLFYSFHDFNRLIEGDWSTSPTRPRGHYGWAYDAITLHTDADDPGSIGDALIHEAAHQAIARRLLPDGASLPTWLDEGLACYFGYTLLDRDGTFRAGAVGGKALPLMRRGTVQVGVDAKRRLEQARRAFRRDDGEAPLVDRLLAADTPARFYDGDVMTHYDVAWLLVHFLLHGDDGAHADAFVRLIVRESEGRGGAAALYEELGLDAAALDAAVRRHAAALRPVVMATSKDGYRGSAATSSD